jgi:hypothetical protein
VDGPRTRKGLGGARRGADDPRAAALRAAGDPAAARALLADHLLRPDAGGWRVEDAAVADSGHRTASRAVFRYAVRLRHEATGATQARTVTAVAYGGGRTARAWRRLLRPGGLPDPAAFGPPLLAAALVPELDLLLQTFPFDHRLPGLWALAGAPPAEVVAPLLERFGPGRWERTSWAAEVVRYHPDVRAAVALDVAARPAGGGGEARRSFFAKAFRDEAKGEGFSEIHGAVWEQTRRGGAPFGVPEPVAWLPALRVQLLGRAPGVPLEAAVADEQAARLAARAVAGLHRLPVAPRWARPAAGEVARVERLAEGIAAAHPKAAARAERLATAVAGALAAGPEAVAHGDLKPAHVLLDGDRVTLIDLDRLSVADPLADVANLAYLLARRLGHRPGAGRPLPGPARALVAAYQAETPPDWAPLLPSRYARVALARAAAGSRGGAAKSPRQAEAALREAEDALAGRLW